jgi:hypothetical protein
MKKMFGVVVLTALVLAVGSFAQSSSARAWGWGYGYGGCGWRYSGCCGCCPGYGYAYYAPYYRYSYYGYYPGYARGPLWRPHLRHRRWW